MENNILYIIIIGLLSFIFFIYVAGVGVNLIIDIYSLMFTEKGKERGNPSLKNLLSWFYTKKLINENKKYKYSKEQIKVSFYIFLFVFILVCMGILHDSGIIDLTPLFNALDKFDKSFNSITGIDQGFFEAAKRLFIFVFSIVTIMIILIFTTSLIRSKNKKV